MVEARRLAFTADVYLEERESRLTGNYLWTTATTLLEGSTTQKKDDTNPDDEPVSPEDHR